MKPILIDEEEEEEAVSELSKPRISSNKLHQTGIKLKQSAKDTEKPTISNKLGHNHYLSPSFSGLRRAEEKGVVTSSSSSCVANEREKKARDFSEDVRYAVKQIESRISALQPSSQTKTSARSFAGDQPVFLGGGLHRERDWRCQERASGDYVHGLRVPTDHNGLAKRMMGQLSKENHKPSREKKLPLQMPIRPTLLYHKPSTSQNRAEVKTSKLSPRHLERDGGSSSSGSTYLSSPTDHQQSSSTSSSSSLRSQTDSTASMAHESSTTRERVDATRRRYRSGRRRNPGRLRRFKNKLGLVFHHHHHHHHHHHNYRDGDHHSGNSRSMWKPLRKMFHHANANVVNEKLKKSTVAKVPHKNHVGHFNTLVEGLLRHVGRQKTRKRIGGVGSKKGAKKFQWWQRFRRHGGVKLPKRRRVRVGF